MRICARGRWGKGYRTRQRWERGRMVIGVIERRMGGDRDDPVIRHAPSSGLARRCSPCAPSAAASRPACPGSARRAKGRRCWRSEPRQTPRAAIDAWALPAIASVGSNATGRLTLCFSLCKRPARVSPWGLSRPRARSRIRERTDGVRYSTRTRALAASPSALAVRWTFKRESLYFFCHRAVLKPLCSPSAKFGRFSDCFAVTNPSKLG